MIQRIKFNDSANPATDFFVIYTNGDALSIEAFTDGRYKSDGDIEKDAGKATTVYMMPPSAKKLAEAILRALANPGKVEIVR